MEHISRVCRRGDQGRSKMKIWRIILTMLLMSFVCCGQAQADIASGSAGEEILWSLSETGVLTVSGQGEIGNYSMEYSEYGYLTDERGRRCSIAVLAAGQKRELGRLLRVEKKGSDTALFLNKLTEHIVDPEGKIVGRREVVLSASADGLTAGDRTYRWDEVSDVSIVQRNLLILHIRDQKEHLEYLGSKRFNAMKYRDAFLCSNRKNGFGQG